jgi:hypothetical protein
VSVVVDEFEVVPAQEDEREAPSAAAETQPEKSKATARDEIERTLRMRAERAARLEAD